MSFIIENLIWYSTIYCGENNIQYYEYASETMKSNDGITIG